MKKVSRREFLRRSLLLSASACCSAAWGLSNQQLAFANSGAPNGNTIVFLNQFGGNDPLNSFTIPFNLDAYYDGRKFNDATNIAIPAGSVLPLNGSVGFHPILSNLHSLYQQGDVAVLFGTGDPVQTRSHFTSQDIMSLGTGSLNSGLKRGWIGRLGDLYFQDHQYNTFALGVGSKLDFLASRLDNRTVSLPSLAKSRIDPDYATGQNLVRRDADYQVEIAKEILELNKGLPSMRKLSKAASKAMFDDVDRLQAAINNFNGSTLYEENGVGRYLKDAATLINDGVGAKLTYGGVGGWDTHSGQGAVTGNQANLLGVLDRNISTFTEDIKAIGKWDETAICVFTEFGRTTKVNSSGGTDHGWGSAMLVIGGAVAGGVYGGEPSADDFGPRRWLYADVDYRSVFSEIVSWLGYDSSPVFVDFNNTTALDLFN